MAPQILNATQTTVLLGAAAIATTMAALWWQRHRARRNKPPSQWRRVGEISELILYPMKSGRGIDLEEAECTAMGLRTTDKAPKHAHHLRDRSFMVYNANNSAFTTCRAFPTLMLISVKHVGDGVVELEAPGVPKFRLTLPDATTGSENKKVTMWLNEEVETVDCGDEVSAWLTAYLKKDGTWLRLGYHVPERMKARKITAHPWDKFVRYYNRIRDEHAGAYGDLFGYMLISESSVDDLKSRLAPHLQAIPPKQFRPNLVVRGSVPYEEDNWDWVKIGDNVIMRGVKPCTRCIMTTMDPETGVKEQSMEPLRTLKQYRQVKAAKAKELEGEAPVLGLYMGLQTGGLVKIGDPIYVGKN